MSQVTNQQTMQAAVWYAAKDLRVEQAPVPTISDSPNKDGAYQMERYNLTPLLGFHGLSGGGGGFSAFTVMGEHMVDIVEKGFEALLNDKAQVKIM